VYYIGGVRSNRGELVVFQLPLNDGIRRFMSLRLNEIRRASGALGSACCVVLSLTCMLAATPPGQLALRVANERAPAGGWAQIKIFAVEPKTVVAGSIAMDFDPAIFGSIASVAVFSATGDTFGYARVQGTHLEAHFSSPSASAGQLPELPILAVSIPVLPGAKDGGSAVVTADPSGATWTDALGNPFTVTVSPGTVIIGPGLSVASVMPGGGVLPAGSVLQIAGAGFDSATTLSIDGVAVGSIRFVNSEHLEVTLGGATEITGKHVHLANANGAAVDYFAAVSNAPGTPPAGFTGPTGIFPLVPVNPFADVVTDNSLLLHPASKRSLAMFNPNPAAVTVVRASRNGPPAADSFTIPTGALYFLYTGEGLQITASAPIRMVELLEISQPLQASSYITVLTPAVADAPPRPIQPALSQNSVSWSWQVGSPQPANINIGVSGNLGFTLKSSSVPWLDVTPTQGTAPATVVLKPNIAQLKPGVYTATVWVVPTAPDGFPSYPTAPSEISVSLTVSAAALISVSAPALVLSQVTPGGALTGDNTLTVASNGSPAPFTLSATTAFGGQWLSATASSVASPATITVTANLAGLIAGAYLGDIAIHGPANILHVLVTLWVQPPGSGNLSVDFRPYFYLAAGSGAASNPQLIHVQSAGAPVQVTAQTARGGNWLSAQVIANAPDPAVIAVNASAANLPPDSYQGAITISTTTMGSMQLPIVLTVFDGQSPPLVSPSSLTLNAMAGQSAAAELTVTSAGGPVLFDATASTGGWLSAYPTVLYPPLGQATTPGVIHVEASAAQAGVYQSEVIVTWSQGTIRVPVTFKVSAAAAPPPPLTEAVLSAASQRPGPIAPGEIITIFGLGVGGTPTGLRLDPSGKVASTLNGTQVTINDVAAPMVYASPGQLNAIVPYEAVAGAVARVRVKYLGQESGAWDVPVASTAPGIFTIGSTGVGPGAVLNQDSSVNGASNPAARGSVVQIFATGEGQTSPAGQTGAVTSSIGGAPVSHVTVTIGGIDAVVQFAGAAPQAVAGLFQVNAVVPQGVPSGSAVPLVLSVGGAPSQAGVTIAVQ
jgi:uncharacterized protein (TIGR03437 family)